VSVSGSVPTTLPVACVPLLNDTVIVDWSAGTELSSVTT
jgi:hypothetical protein